MNVLMLFPYAPQPPPYDLAAIRRSLPFFLELAKYHQVTILSYGTPEEEERFRNAYGHLCRSARFVNRKRPIIFNVFELLGLLLTGRSSFSRLYRPSMQQALSEMAAEGSFDVIYACFHTFGFFELPSGIPVVGDAHDVAYYLAYRTANTTRRWLPRTLAYLDYRFGKREEIRACRKLDILTTTTDKDRAVFQKDLPDLNIVPIQNGVMKSFFEELPIEQEPFTMVFTGLFSHVPNSEGMFFFLDLVFHRILAQVPSARVFVVGKDPPRALLARASQNVIVTGFVPDVRPYMARAQVFIIPLLAGTGIRGKALEAMAMKRPIVTTSLGVEGIHLGHEQSALFADTPEAFAAAVIRLFGDRTLRERLAQSAYAIVRAEYDWEAKGKELDLVLQAAVRAHRENQRRGLLLSTLATE